MGGHELVSGKGRAGSLPGGGDDCSESSQQRDGMNKGPVAGRSLEFKKLEEGLHDRESQGEGEIAQNGAGEVGRATPHWASALVQESWLTCPAAHLSTCPRCAAEPGAESVSGLVFPASPLPTPAPSTRPGSHGAGVSTLTFSPLLIPALGTHLWTAHHNGPSGPQTVHQQPLHLSASLSPCFHSLVLLCLPHSVQILHHVLECNERET